MYNIWDVTYTIIYYNYYYMYKIFKMWSWTQRQNQTTNRNPQSSKGLVTHINNDILFFISTHTYLIR